MIITQTFYRGREEECGKQFFEVVPDDDDLQKALDTVLKMIRDSVTYKSHFIITVDTDRKSATVTEAV